MSGPSGSSSSVGSVTENGRWWSAQTCVVRSLATPGSLLACRRFKGYGGRWQVLGGLYLNPELPPEAFDDAYRKVLRIDARTLLERNRLCQRMVVDGVTVEYCREDGSIGRRGEALGLSDDEIAFYDALETNDSAVKVLGDENLRKIARELVATVRANVTIDWTMRENVRAQLRVLVKRILRKYGYPPDKQEKATQLVLEQAEVLSAAWA